MSEQFKDDTWSFEDLSNLGRPPYFSLSHYAEAIRQMIVADEIESARWMLDNPPSWYRANYPKELQEIRNTLNRQCYDIFDYSDDPDERGYTLDGVRAQLDSGYCFPRFNIVDDFVVELNQKMFSPWICELSPSHGPLPIGLMDKQRMFNFYGKNMNHLATSRFKEWLKPNIWQEKPLPGQPRVLVIFEVFEHASRPEDVVQAAFKISPEWDYIFLSVPNMCLGGGLPNWSNRRLGHIRTYTPKEFAMFADKSFPGFSWEIGALISIVMSGKKL